MTYSELWFVEKYASGKGAREERLYRCRNGNFNFIINGRRTIAAFATREEAADFRCRYNEGNEHRADDMKTLMEEIEKISQERKAIRAKMLAAARAFLDSIGE